MTKSENLAAKKAVIDQISEEFAEVLYKRDFSRKAGISKQLADHYRKKGLANPEIQINLLIKYYSN